MRTASAHARWGIALSSFAFALAGAGRAHAEEGVQGPPPPPPDGEVRVRVTHANGIAGRVSAHDPATDSVRDLCALPCESHVRPGTWLDITWGDGGKKSYFVNRRTAPGEVVDLVVREQHSSLHYGAAGVLTVAAIVFTIIGVAELGSTTKGYGGGVAKVIGVIGLAHGAIFGGVATAMLLTSGSRIDRRSEAPERPAAPQETSRAAIPLQLGFSF